MEKEFKECKICIEGTEKGCSVQIKGSVIALLAGLSTFVNTLSEKANLTDEMIMRSVRIGLNSKSKTQTEIEDLFSLFGRN